MTIEPSNKNTKVYKIYKETATAGGTSAGGIAGFATGIGSPVKKRKKKPIIKRQMKEGLAELAGTVDQDHEVQMARSDLYKIAQYAIELHGILKNISEAKGLEGWIQAKITKAADYMSAVYHNLNYETKVASSENIDVRNVLARSNEAVDLYKYTLHTRLNEKAVSKAQQRAAGVALAAKRKGEKPKGKSAAGNMAKMSTKELEKFAGTKHKNLPKKKTNETLNLQAKKIKGKFATTTKKTESENKYFEEFFYEEELKPVLISLFKKMYPEAEVQIDDYDDGYLNSRTTDGEFQFSIGIANVEGENIVTVANAYSGKYRGIVGRLVQAGVKILKKHHPDAETYLNVQHDVSNNYWLTLANKLGIQYDNLDWDKNALDNLKRLFGK